MRKSKLGRGKSKDKNLVVFPFNSGYSFRYESDGWTLVIFEGGFHGNSICSG